MEMMIWILVVILVFFTTCSILRIKKRNVLLIFLVIVVHFFFSWIFLEYTEDKVNDSLNYYIWAKEGGEFGFTGTGFIVFLVKTLLNIGITEYVHVFMVFSTISAIGIVTLFNFLLNLNNHGQRGLDILLFLCFLLPGLHFWTVSIGKDSLSVALIALILISTLNKRPFIFIGLIIILFLVRSYIALLICGCLGIYLFLYYKPHRISYGIIRSSLFLLSVPILGVVFSFLMKTIQKYSATGFDSFTDFVTNRQEVYAETDAGAILVGQPYIIKVFAQIFGAIPWVSMNSLSLFSFLEGFIVFLLLSSIFYLVFIKRNIKADITRFWLFFIISFVFVMPIISTNLGIMVRMRVMIYLPIFVVLFCHLHNKYCMYRKSYV